MIVSWRALTTTLAIAGAACACSLSAASVQAQAPQPAAEAPAKATKATAKKAKKPEAEGGDAATATAKTDPAEVQKTLDAGIKQMQAGKLDPAIAAFSGVVSRGKVPPNLMSRALYNRGLAYRRQGKPAQAISDLTSALWLKGGLSDTERADAIENRSAAYREAGLPDQTDADGKASTGQRTRSADQSGAARTAGAAPSASLAPSGEQTANGSGGLGNLFGGLFGGSKAAPAAEPAPAAAPKQAALSGWSNVTEVKPGAGAKGSVATGSVQPNAAPPARVNVAKVAPATPATGPAPVAGTFRLQLAMVKSQAEADQVVAKATQQLGASMGPPAIDTTTFGGTTFYRVRIGAFASQNEAQVQCAKLKAAGLDCHVPR